MCETAPAVRGLAFGCVNFAVKDVGAVFVSDRVAHGAKGEPVTANAEQAEVKSECWFHGSMCKNVVLTASAKKREGEDKDGTKEDAEANKLMPERQVVASNGLVREAVFIS
jgi:hypothetical protein